MQPMISTVVRSGIVLKVVRKRSMLTSGIPIKVEKSEENMERREREQIERAQARAFIGNCCLLEAQSRRGRNIEERKGVT